MRKNPPAKWVLPLVVNPPTSTPWCVPVPDDPYHKAAFLGALQALGSAYKWQDDLDHTAKEVAQVWREIADNLERCMTEPKTIVVEEWEDTLAICESLRWNDGVLEGYCCGEWVPISGASGGVVPSPVVQPNGQSRPLPGESACFNVVLSGQQRWQLPMPVLPGDIVTVSAVSGTWSDGGLSPWYTPDGHTAIFGISTGGGQGHSGGDPFATPYHMALVAFTPSEDFSAVDDSPFTIAGSGSQQLTFQANDDPLSDNGGSIAFRVCVQNGGTIPVTDWCYYFDFTASPYGFVSYPAGAGYGAVWVPGIGWQEDPSFPGRVDIVVALGGALTIRKETVVDYSVTATNPSTGGDTLVPGQGVVSFIHPLPTGVSSSDTPDTDRTGTQLWFAAQGIAGANTIIGATVRGTGVNPFGVDNC